ncbi:hypothetical protein QJQ45_029507 [Haematococcus lacustris]|nr:hypothetical protein QJQ45_029507 [Haematococcus lacustris]
MLNRQQMHASKCTRPSLRPHCSRHTARCRPAAAAASDVYRPPSVAPALSELALLAQFSKIVPDQLQLPSTVEGVQLATAASVTFGQLRAIAASLNSTPLQNCIAAARNYHPDPERQVEKAMVNVGTLLADQVQGRIATEVDPRLANDKDGMVLKARALLSLYREAGLPRDRLLFRLPATWAGVQAARQLESANIPTQLQVHSLVQGAAAAQAGVSVVSVNVGRTREWYARHPGAIRDPQGPRQDAGGLSGPDPGVALACDVYNYVKAYHQRTQVMASGLRTREVAPRKPPQSPRSSQAATQAAASEPGPSTPLPAKRSKRTKAEPAAEVSKGKAAKAKPAPQPGRWLDRDCNAALNMQRIGESRWRLLELCWWPQQGALPAKGKEYPGLGYKRLRDKPPKAQQQQQQQPAEAQVAEWWVNECAGSAQLGVACSGTVRCVVGPVNYAEALAGCDFLLLPGSVIQALAATPTAAGYNDGWRAGGPGGEEEEEPGLRARLSPEAAKAAAPAEMEQLTEALFRERLGQAGSELLARALKDSVESTPVVMRVPFMRRAVITTALVALAAVATMGVLAQPSPPVPSPPTLAPRPFALPLPLPELLPQLPSMPVTSLLITFYGLDLWSLVSSWNSSIQALLEVQPSLSLGALTAPGMCASNLLALNITALNNTSLTAQQLMPGLGYFASDVTQLLRGFLQDSSIVVQVQDFCAGNYTLASFPVGSSVQSGPWPTLHVTITLQAPEPATRGALTSKDTLGFFSLYAMPFQRCQAALLPAPSPPPPSPPTPTPPALTLSPSPHPARAAAPCPCPLTPPTHPSCPTPSQPQPLSTTTQPHPSCPTPAPAFSTATAFKLPTACTTEPTLATPSFPLPSPFPPPPPPLPPLLHPPLAPLLAPLPPLLPFHASTPTQLHYQVSVGQSTTWDGLVSRDSINQPLVVYGPIYGVAANVTITNCFQGMPAWNSLIQLFQGHSLSQIIFCNMAASPQLNPVINNFDLPSCPYGAQLSGLSYNFAAGLTYWVLMAGNGIAPISDARLLVTAAYWGSIQRPLELCSYEGLEALPPAGKEYQQRYKLVNDRLPKARQRLHRAAEYRRASPSGDPMTGQLQADQLRRWKLTKGEVKHGSGLNNARRDTERWLAPIKPHLQHLAAASSAGTSLEANLKHITVTLATWDAVWEVYLDPKWAEQRLRLYGAQDRTLEQFFKKLEEDMAEVSMERHGRAKQLVVFFGAAGIGTRGGWGADAVLRACCKVVCRPRGTDQRRGRVVLVDEHRTSRVSSAVNGQQPCERQLNKRRATRPAGWKPPAGQVQQRLLRPAWSQQRDQPVRGMMWCPVVAPRKPPQAPRSSQAAPQPAASEPGPSTPLPAKRSKRTKAEQAAEPTKGKGKAAKTKPAPQPGRWLDRDCNAALNMQRIGESKWRPLELCFWPEQGKLPAKGKEYPGLGYKQLRDKPPKAKQQQQPAEAQQPHSQATTRAAASEPEPSAVPIASHAQQG